MKNILLAALFSFGAFGVQAQTLTINNHTACPVNVYPFTGSTCPNAGGIYCGITGGGPYVAGAYSVSVINQSSMSCSGPWAYAALNTNPNGMGYADGCQVGTLVWDGNKLVCNTIYSGSFYVVSCGSFVNVTWTSNTPTPGDVTIDIN